MKPEPFIITKLLDGGIAENKPVVWQNALTHDNRKITFWGTINPISIRNINTIEQQDVPFIVEITNAEYNSQYKRNYDTDISVNEGCSVTVNSLSAQLVGLLITPENIDNVQQQLEQVSVFRETQAELTAPTEN